MGSIERRERTDPDGETYVRYRARTRGPDGRQRSKTFRRKTDAERWLTGQEASKLGGTWIDPAQAKVKYGDWLDRWWRTRQGRPSTIARDDSYFRNHVRPTFGTTPIGKITQPDVVEWVHHLEGKGLAPATVRKAYQLFAKTMSAAVAARLIVSSPCVEIELPEVEQHEMMFLDPQQVAKLAAVIDSRYRALVFVAAWGGLRVGEVAGLTRSRLLPATKQVEVAETVAWVKGHPHVGPPKTKAGRRRVVLPGAVWSELEDHVRQHAGDELVFPAPGGGYLQPTHFRRRVWKPAVKKIGQAGLRVHDLRHTAVSLWIASGADVKAVSVRAGHASVSFTLDRYGHLYPDADAALAGRLDAMVKTATAGGDNVVPLRTAT